MQRLQESMQDMRQWVPRLESREGPIYLAVADAIATGIRSGALRGGDRLPTHRALADALGVDLTTITRAYGEARRRGLLQATTGRGTFVRAAEQPVPRQQAAEPEIIDLAMNLPPQPIDPPLQQLLQQGLVELLAGRNAASLLTYRPGAGSIEERAAGAAWLEPTLGAVDPGRMLVSPGAQPALLAALGAVAQAGDIVLTDRLTYPGFRGVAAQLGVQLAGVAADADGLLPEAVEETCREVRPKALYCVPTIHNPTTVTMPLDRRRAIAEVARRHGLRIVEDDAYGLLPSTPLPAIASLMPDITFHIATLSKVISPTLRLAYLVAPDASCTARLCAALRANVLMASPLLSSLVAAWIEDGTADAVISAIRRESAARQGIAREILPVGSFDAHSEGLHLWLRLPPRWERRDFVAHLRRQGLALVPSDVFAVGEDTPQNAVRVSLGAASSQEQLRAALRAVAAVFSEEIFVPFSEVV
jgi:DNA-binding transcriptional MocR family regulator